MSYYVTIRRYFIHKEGKVSEDEVTGIGEPFKDVDIDRGEMDGKETTFINLENKNFDWKEGVFESRLTELSERGFKGYIIIAGEEGEFFKYLLMGDGRVKRHYQKRIGFSEEPQEVLGKTNKNLYKCRIEDLRDEFPEEVEVISDEELSRREIIRKAKEKAWEEVRSYVSCPRMGARVKERK